MKSLELFLIALVMTGCATTKPAAPAPTPKPQVAKPLLPQIFDILDKAQD